MLSSSVGVGAAGTPPLTPSSLTLTTLLAAPRASLLSLRSQLHASRHACALDCAAHASPATAPLLCRRAKRRRERTPPGARRSRRIKDKGIECGECLPRVLHSALQGFEATLCPSARPCRPLDSLPPQCTRRMKTFSWTKPPVATSAALAQSLPGPHLWPTPTPPRAPVPAASSLGLLLRLRRQQTQRPLPLPLQQPLKRGKSTAVFPTQRTSAANSREWECGCQL